MPASRNLPVSQLFSAKHDKGLTDHEDLADHWNASLKICKHKDNSSNAMIKMQWTHSANVLKCGYLLQLFLNPEQGPNHGQDIIGITTMASFAMNALSNVVRDDDQR